MKYRFYVYILYIVCEVKIYLKFNFFGFWFSIFSFRCLFVLFLMKEETKCRQTPPIFKYPFTLFSFSPFSFLSFCSGLVFVLFRLAFSFLLFFFVTSVRLVRSSSRGPSLLHPTRQPRDHARRQRQHHLRGRGVTHALRQVDAGSGGPDPRRRHARGPQRLGAHGRQGFRQLHVCGHVQFGSHRSRCSDHGEM